MKKFRQTEQQGVKFPEIIDISSTELPVAKFYNDLCRKLFEQYTCFNDLDLGWRNNKKLIADWIATRLSGGSRVLSVGCGLGYMEYYLHMHYAERFELRVSDFSNDALRWIKEVLPAERIYNAVDYKKQMALCAGQL